MIFRESAPLSEPFSFAKSAEYPIPPRNVTIIKLVQITLMMNRVMLWPLQEIANPARRSQVAVIKIFSHYREHVEPCSSGRRSAEQRECKSTGEDRIRDDFNRMLIKGCQYLDAGRAVVNLMAYAPENVKIMSRSVPPIEYKGPDEPTDRSLQQWRQTCQMKNRPPLKPLVPTLAREHDDSELAHIQECSTNVPTARLRQFSARKNALKNEEREGCSDNNGDLDHWLSPFPLHQVVNWVELRRKFTGSRHTA